MILVLAVAEKSLRSVVGRKIDNTVIMKSLKFKDFKAEMILAGEKTSSMRLFDDKNIQTGDNLDLINSDTGEIFAQAQVVQVIEKKIGGVEAKDLIGHEKFDSQEAMLQVFKKYYGDKVGLETTVKIVRFKLS